MSSSDVVSFLEVDGRVLSGEEKVEYCKNHGLCQKCAKVRTHRRVVKMFGGGRKWEPMNLYNDMTGEYTVYKGYCLAPQCYTLGQSKRLLGERGNKRGSSRSNRLTDRLKGARRPGRRKARANPETGSVMSTMDDDMSIASDMSGISTRSGLSVMSGLSAMSGLSGFRKRRKNRNRGSNASSASSVSSGLSSLDDDDDDLTVDTTMTKDVNPEVDDGEVNPIVAHRMEQLTQFEYFTVLDLSKVALRDEDISVVVNGITEATTLESLTLDKCKLRDAGVQKIMDALRIGGHVNLTKISLRQNNMGNKGADALLNFLEESSTLQELDLSENAVSSEGAAAIFGALAQNPSTALHTLNISQNELWGLDDGTYLRTTKTLKVLNLDGNFMHDEGAGKIAAALIENKGSSLEKLYLGWNGIADEGATALARMIEANASLQVLGLAENDITNVGARAILASLSVNTSVREISGLYHNQIDRKFIIVAIKRLLHRYQDRGQTTIHAPVSNENEEEKLPDGEGSDSEGSTNWAAQMFSEPPSDEKQAVAIEAIEAWDWGTFGIEEIEESTRADVPAPMVEASDSEDEEINTYATVKKGRISLFRSAPLAYFDRHTSEHHEVPLLDFEYEKNALDKYFKEEQISSSASIELVHEIATQDRLTEFFSRGTSPILHFSGYGHRDCLALENGFGYLQALPRDALKDMVTLNQDSTKIVFVSSIHATNTSKIFLAAGVKHVVCCERDSAFRDEASVEFAKVFYGALAQENNLQDAFDIALQAIKHSVSKSTARKASDRFMLLPKKPKSSSYHKINVLFEQSLPKKPTMPIPGDISMLPPLPSHFVGREVDMYEVLESLRVDDVVRVGGLEGSGKASLLSAVSRYVLARPTSFGISAVFWLPPPEDVFPEEDTCYGDLTQVMELLMEAEDDIWDEDLYAECRERIMVELEDQRTILIVDGRNFATEAAGENLERLLSYLLNEVNVKIILLTAQEGKSRSKRSRSEETMITIRPLDFKATSLLFGNACIYVSPMGNAIAQTADEFASFLATPSIQKQGVDQHKKLSARQQELFDRMGSGNPKQIMECAKKTSVEELTALIRIAKRPEAIVNSAEELKHELAKWKAQHEHAIRSKNFARAQDLSKTLQTLEAMKSDYPSLNSLADKEVELKKEYTDLLKAKKYDEATRVKRKILALKKDMLKEKFAKPSGSPTKAPISKKLQELQEKMDAMSLAATKVKLVENDKARASFVVQRVDGSTCILRIYAGEPIEDFKPTVGTSGIVCWTNENCDLTVDTLGKKYLAAGGTNLKGDIDDLGTVVETEWGPARIEMGGADIVGPSVYPGISSRYVILAVPPISPSNDDADLDTSKDDDLIHFLEMMLRSSYRSSFRMIKKTGMTSVAFPSITTKEDGRLYEKTLQIGLKTLAEEARSTKLDSIHFLACSEKEAKILIKLADANGIVGE